MSQRPYVDRYNSQRAKVAPDPELIPQTQYHWNYYCNTEQTGIDEYGVNQPTTCINGADHNCNWPAMRNEQYVPNFWRQTRERYITNQHYRVKTLSVDAQPGQTGTATVQFQYPVNIIKFGFVPDESQIGNIVDVSGVRNMTQGVLFKQYPKGTKEFEVSAEFFEYISIGYRVTIQDGTNSTDLGEVVLIDLDNNAFTTENGSNFDFSETATLTVTKPFVQQWEISSIEKKSFQYDLYSYLDPSFTLTLTYTNQGNQPAHFVFEYEISY